MIQPEPAVKQKKILKTWHLLYSGRAHCSNMLRVFQDRKRAACSSPTGRAEHVFIWGKSFRWYIKHQSKVSFPLTFLVLSPSKGHGPLYWAHMHTRDQKKNKQRPFKYQPAFCLNGGATAQPGPGSSSALGALNHGKWGTIANKSIVVVISAGILLNSLYF